MLSRLEKNSNLVDIIFIFIFIFIFIVHLAEFLFVS